MWGLAEAACDPTMGKVARMCVGWGSAVYYVVLLPLAWMATI